VRIVPDHVHLAGLAELLVQRPADFADDTLNARGAPAAALDECEDILNVDPDPLHAAPDCLRRR